jgi:hypothetical protein
MLWYWAGRVLGYSMVDISRRLKISLPTAGISVQKGEKIIRDEGWSLEKYLNVNI